MKNILFSTQLNYKFLITFLLIIPICLQAAQNDQMRGKRYCEIIIPKSLSKYAVYNTWGLNDCPENQWSKVTTTCVQKETGASRVHLNGPRYWVIDGFKNTKLINSVTKSICGLSAREAGVLKLNLFDLLKSNTPYKTHTVKRQTTWVYQVGRPVYELIDPTGKVFVMQSYSIQHIQQTQASLVHLGSKLTLPTGWQFKTGKLKKLELLQAINNKATVVQDDFLNTYQLADHDFLS